MLYEETFFCRGLAGDTLKPLERMIGDDKQIILALKWLLLADKDDSLKNPFKDETAEKLDDIKNILKNPVEYQYLKKNASPENLTIFHEAFLAIINEKIKFLKKLTPEEKDRREHEAQQEHKRRLSSSAKISRALTLMPPPESQKDIICLTGFGPDNPPAYLDDCPPPLSRPARIALSLRNVFTQRTDPDPRNPDPHNPRSCNIL
ncbi:MAG: hypothetical protein KAT71_05555 [Gammaproteobacteria bacterium]|nr:hypothetical protein [Gammaproteobacteria bacterium]